MKQKPQSKRSWAGTLAALYFGGSMGAVGTGIFLDGTALPPPILPPLQEVRLPSEVFSPEPMTSPHDALPPCTADAVPRPVQSQPVRASREMGTVAPGELNVRATPGGRIVGQVFKGDQIEILERPTSGLGAGWLRTPAGWVSARFIESPHRGLVPIPGPCLFPGLCSQGEGS